MTTDTGIRAFWNRLDRRKRIGLGAGVVTCIAAAVLLFVWAARKDYDVLFSQLAEPDAASIVAQLKKQKVPYVLADRGATIKVPAERVHETRLGLMAGGVPLSELRVAEGGGLEQLFLSLTSRSGEVEEDG